MPALFDERERKDVRPAGYGEDSFTFLNRAVGRYWDKVRAELDGWYAAFPDENGGLRQRCRHRSPDQHYAAWWELYLHRVLSCLGFTIQVEQPVEGTSKRPDFLAGTSQIALARKRPRIKPDETYVQSTLARVARIQSPMSLPSLRLKR